MHSSLSSIGEFGLIDHLMKDFLVYDKNISLGVGDDAAVIKTDENFFQVVTTDTLVENDHFTLAWSTPEQIGMKAMEVNVSDVAAMGAVPTHATISLVISKETNLEFLEKLYHGIRSVCEKYKISLIGGDTTRGGLHMISITMWGKTDKKNLCLRSDAKPDDLICVTGEVGKSAAGYFGFRKFFKSRNTVHNIFTKEKPAKFSQKNSKNNQNFESSEIQIKSDTLLSSYLQKHHLEPKSQLELSQKIARYVNAMIDVSDGVGSEIRHIAKASMVGAKIFANKLPIHQDVFDMEKKLGIKKYTCALSGGEDFELLFTISPKNFRSLTDCVSPLENKKITIIGKILQNPDDLILEFYDGRQEEIPGGWDHTKKPDNNL